MHTRTYFEYTLFSIYSLIYLIFMKMDLNKEFSIDVTHLEINTQFKNLVTEIQFPFQFIL